MDNAEKLLIPNPMNPIEIAGNNMLIPLFSMLCNSNIGQRNIQESLLMSILYLVSVTENTRLDKSIASKVIHYVDEHLHEPLTAQSVAAALNYNKDYISRAMHKTTGYTMKEYIIRRKLDTACTLLRTSAFSIEEIANQIGFNDSNLFTKFFIYHNHISPTEYRKRVIFDIC